MASPECCQIVGPGRASVDAQAEDCFRDAAQSLDRRLAERFLDREDFPTGAFGQTASDRPHRSSSGSRSCQRSTAPGTASIDSLPPPPKSCLPVLEADGTGSVRGFPTSGFETPESSVANDPRLNAGDVAGDWGISKENEGTELDSGPVAGQPTAVFAGSIPATGMVT